MSSQSFKDLLVWQKAHALVLKIYKLTNTFPKYELYSLTSQLRRAPFSVPANIAEGYRKQGKMDKSRFFNIAQGSLEEVRYYLILANDLEYAHTEKIEEQTDEVAKILYSYNRAVRK